MSEDTQQAARWLLSVLQNEGPPPLRPSWLEGAVVTISDGKDSILSVVVELTNGSRFSVAVMHTVKTAAQHENLRRQAEVYYSSPEHAEFPNQLRRQQAEDDEHIRAAHTNEGHGGPFESCGVEKCRLARGANPGWWRDARVEKGGNDST